MRKISKKISILMIVSGLFIFSLLSFLVKSTFQKSKSYVSYNAMEWKEIDPYSHIGLTTDGKLWTWKTQDEETIYDGGIQNITFKSIIPVETDFLVDEIYYHPSWNFHIVKDNEGYLYAKGDNHRYAFGICNSEIDYNDFQPILPNVQFSKAYFGYDGLSIGIDFEGNVWSWGASIIYSNSLCKTPQIIISDKEIVDVYAGNGAFFAKSSDGKLWGWGYSDSGQLGFVSDVYTENPVIVFDDVEIIDAHIESYSTHFLDSTGKIWGIGPANDTGLGVNAVKEYTVLNIDTPITELAGRFALDENGDLWGWGNNYFGDLARSNETEVYYEPVKVLSDKSIVSCIENYTYDHFFAIDEDGNIWGWGYNDGLIDSENIGEIISPRIINSSARFSKITLGDDSIYAIDVNGNLWNWGEISYTKRINGTENYYYNPVKINKNITNIKKVIQSRNYSSTFVIDNFGQIWGWGIAEFTVLTGEQGWYGSFEPVLLTDSNIKYVDIATNTGVNIALDEDGNIWSWGSNGYGRLGNGSSESNYIPYPKQITDEIRYVDVETVSELDTSLALDEDGNIWIWGRVWDKTISDYNVVPTKINVDATFIDITFGSFDIIYAIDNFGNIWAFEANANMYDGQSIVLHESRYPVFTKITNGTVFVDIDENMAVDNEGNLWASNVDLLNSESLTFKKVLENRNLKQVKDKIVLDSNGNLFSFNTEAEYSQKEVYKVLNGELESLTLIPIKFTNKIVDFDKNAAVDEKGNLWTWGDNFNVGKTSLSYYGVNSNYYFTKPKLHIYGTNKTVIAGNDIFVSNVNSKQTAIKEIGIINGKLDYDVNDDIASIYDEEMLKDNSISPYQYTINWFDSNDIWFNELEESKTISIESEKHSSVEVGNPKFKSNDTSIVNVNENTGEVTAISPGKTSITITDPRGLYELTSEVKVAGIKYSTINSKIKVPINQTVNDVLNNVIPPEDGNVKVFDLNNNQIINKKLGTGMKVKINDGLNDNEYRIVIKGDVTGTGTIGIADVVKLYQHHKGKIAIEEDYFIEAGKVAGDDEISMNEVVKLYQYFKGKIGNL